jgi:hypothetical protein
MQLRAPHETQTPHTEPRADPPQTLPHASTRLDRRGLRRFARLRGWKLPITDGPFAESKEMLGG